MLNKDTLIKYWQTEIEMRINSIINFFDKDMIDKKHEKEFIQDIQELYYIYGYIQTDYFLEGYNENINRM